MVIVENLLLNLLIILFLLFLLLLWLTYQDRFQREKRYAIILTASLMVMLCMIFPVRINEHFIYDLRSIPALLGGLYGGPFAIIVILIVTIIYRATLGGIGIITTMIMAALTAILSLFIYKQFNAFSSKQKIGVSVSLSLLFSLVTLVVMHLLFDAPYQNIGALSFIPIQTLGMFITASMAEMIRTNYYAQKNMVKAKRLEIASHLTSSFCHEIRNPMTASLGFMQLLLQDLQLAPEKRKEYIHIAIKELKYAEHIIQNYLTFAKPEGMKKEELCVQKEIQHAIDMIRPLANMSSIQITASLCTADILGERQLFQQSIINILKNGIEAMPDGGVLSITSYTDSDCVFITLKDSGEGMTEQQMERLGEPFFSIKEAKGTGLGMMVVYQIVRAMDGTVTVTSQIKKGTTVSIRLPLRAKSTLTVS